MNILAFITKAVPLNSSVLLALAENSIVSTAEALAQKLGLSLPGNDKVKEARALLSFEVNNWGFNMRFLEHHCYKGYFIRALEKATALMLTIVPKMMNSVNIYRTGFFLLFLLLNFLFQYFFFRFFPLVPQGRF